MPKNTHNVEVAFDYLEDFTIYLNQLDMDERLALAHLLQGLYARNPEHKEWVQKLHEMLDIS